MAFYLRGVAKQKKGDKAGGTADVAAANKRLPRAGGFSLADFTPGLGLPEAAPVAADVRVWHFSDLVRCLT